MWRLVMGAAYSDEEEEREEEVGTEEAKHLPPLGHTLNSAGAPVRQAPPPGQMVAEGQQEQCREQEEGEECREQGDGMEREEPGVTRPAEELPTPESPLLPLPLPKVSTTFPLDWAGGLVLAKLPPIHDSVELRPGRPAGAKLLPDRAKVFPRGSLPPAVRRQREPKFVPYEPYRGAVTAMEGAGSRRPPLLGRGSRGSSVESSPADRPSPARGEGWGEEGSPLAANYAVMLRAKEQELEELVARAEGAERQLKIQAKVNSEVKRLLVASVGEDIEARVAFLTQDKARLAADVMQYSNQIATDWEARETLGVESDVWKSKYLASSVIVEELERGRREAAGRAEAAEHASRRLLGERAGLRAGLAAATATICNLTAAFDPLSPRKQPADGGKPLNLVEAVAALEVAATGLAGRLVGEAKLPAAVEAAGELAVADTPAEAEVRRVLGRPLGHQTTLPEAASSVLAKEARPHLLRLGDQAGSPHRLHGAEGFSPCSHCSSTVQVV